MPVHNIDIKHAQKKRYQLGDRLRNIFDSFIYVSIVFGVLANVPQIVKIYVGHNASGVSLASWIMFAMLSISWLIYGILHKEKPIIIMNLSLIITQIAIAVGIVVYG